MGGHRIQGGLTQSEDQTILFGQFRGFWDKSIKVARAHRKDSIDQISPGCDQLLIDSAEDLVVAEVGVVLLRENCRDRIAQSVRLETLVVPGNRPSDSPARRCFVTTESQVLVGGDVCGQVEVAVTHQHRRPDHRMERNVVFADEVVGLRLRVLPPFLPLVGVIGVRSPLDRRREIADHRIEPHIDLLAWAQIVDRYVDTPVDVAGDCSFRHVCHHSQSPVLDVFAPRRFALEPLLKPVGEGGQVEKIVLGFTKHGGSTTQSGSGVDQVDSVQRSATVVALIATGVFVATVWAGPFDIAIRQVALGFRIVELLGDLLVEIAVFE